MEQEKDQQKRSGCHREDTTSSVSKLIPPFNFRFFPFVFVDNAPLVVALTDMYGTLYGNGWTSGQLC